MAPKPPAPPSPPLIWDRLPAARERRATLTLDRIVDAAMHVADRDGLQAVSMRRIGAELGAGAMSLYRYVQRKEDLLDLLLDAAFGEIRLPDRPASDWREALRVVARETRAALKRHPWLGALLSTRPPLGPNYLRYFEHSLESLARLTEDPEGMARLGRTFSVYVMGFVGYELAEADAQQRAGISDAEKRAVVAPYLARVMAGGALPRLRSYLPVAREQPDDRDFAFGLECVLDGMEAHAGRSSRKAPRPRPRARRTRRP